MSVPADVHPATDVRCCPYQGPGLHDLHPVNRQLLQSHHQFAPCQHRSPWLDQQHWWEGRGLQRHTCTAPLQSPLYFAWKTNTVFIFPLLLLLQAVQPRPADGCGRSLGERASVLCPTCGQHVAGQRDGPAVSGGDGFRL